MVYFKLKTVTINMWVLLGLFSHNKNINVITFWYFFFRCGAKSMIPICNMINPATNSTYTEFNSEIILLATQVEWPLIYYLAVLIGIFVITKILWYIAMRRRTSDEWDRKKSSQLFQQNWVIEWFLRNAK